jgi:hypothetical protein
MFESVKVRLIVLGKGDDQATVYPFNAYWQVNDAQGKTHNYRELTHALKDLLNDGYFIRDVLRSIN